MKGYCYTHTLFHVVNIYSGYHERNSIVDYFIHFKKCINYVYYQTKNTLEIVS